MYQTTIKKAHAVQEVYREHKKEGVTNIGIYRKYIKNQFFISEKTFYSLLTVNVNQELRKLEKLKEKS
jgi:hypothetical protein